MVTKRSRIDRVMALAVGVIAFVLLSIWSFPGIHPYAWTDMAVGAGLLPPSGMLPGLGGFFSRLIFAILPLDAGIFVNVTVAKLMMAACGWMSFGMLYDIMMLVSGMGARDWRRRALAMRVAAFVGSLAFVCSDPVWNAAQGVTGSTMVLFLSVVTGKLFAKFLETASLPYAIAMLAATGFLCAETPIGWLALGLGVFLTVRYLSQPQTDAWKDFLDPVEMQRTKWSMTFVFIGAFLVGVTFECVAYAWLDGMRATGVTYGELPIQYMKSYGDLVVASMSIPGLCLFVLAVLIPFALSALLITPSTDEDRYLSFKFSILYFLVGAVAFLQLSPFEFTWFWNVMDGAIASKQVLVFSSLLSSVTLAFALYVLGVEIFCRDYEHIENVMYQSYSDDAGEGRAGHDDVVSVRMTFGRTAMLVVPLLALVTVLAGRRLPCDRALLDVIHRFVDETIVESEGSRYLFTDGSYDAALRLESRRRGVSLIPVSLMSGASRRDAYIRQLGSEDFEDRMTLETGAAEALRTWVMSKSEKLSEVSVQIAFEMFRLNRHLRPTVYGLLVRPVGGDEKAAAESVERCHALADRIVELHEKGGWRHAKNRFLKDRFLFAQFRLAVMSRLRAIDLDSQKKVKESIEEIAYADRLNANNPSLVRIMKRMDWVRRESGEALSPREGLEVAMKRADFVMARRYAMPVLREDADEPNANFAVGMSYYAEEQYAKAEEYLKRVLKRSPKEPAVYNNIALICLKTGRLEEAEKQAKLAQNLLPDSPEVRDTVNQIKQAMAKRAQPKRRQ